MKKLLPKMLKRVGYILVILLYFLVPLVLLTSTVKGELGNPTAKYVHEKLKHATMPFENAPERNRYAQLLSIVEYGTTTLPLEVAKTVTPDLGYFNGKYVGLYPPGFLALALPFYIVGKYFGVAQLATFLIPVIFALISLFLIKNISKKLEIGTFPALASGTLFLFGTSTWAYTTTIYQHIITTVILLAIFRLILAKRTILTVGTVWALAFYAFILDTPNVFFVIPFVLYMIFEKCSIDKKLKKIKFVFSKKLIYGAFFVLPLFAAWAFYNIQTYSTPIKLSQGVTSIRKFDKFDRPILPQDKKANDVSTFLSYASLADGSTVLTYSRDRGILLYSPFIVLALFGVRSLLRKTKNHIVLLMSVIVSIFIVYAAWGDPWGGWAFGPRYLIPALGLMSIFLAQAIQQYRRNWLFLTALVSTGLYSIGINTLGAITTNQVPPYHEATGLNMKYNFLLNWDYLNNNMSGSFIFNTFFRKSLTLIQYAGTLVSIAGIMFLTLLVGVVVKKRK